MISPEDKAAIARMARLVADRPELECLAHALTANLGAVEAERELRYVAAINDHRSGCCHGTAPAS